MGPHKRMAGGLARIRSLVKTDLGDGDYWCQALMARR